MIGLIVTQGSLPCTLYNAAGLKRGGVLMPAKDGEAVAMFLTPRDARRAIARTERVASQLKGSLVSDWVRLAPLTSGQAYALLPVVRSHAGVPSPTKGGGD